MSLGGWVKVHRALSDHHISSDPATLSVWIHLLLLANHKETKRMINGRVIAIQPGQLITSRKSLAAKTGVNESKVERVLNTLKNEQQIEQHGTSKFRVISIVKWSEYQSDEQQNEHLVNSKRTADEQQMNTPEEVSSDTKNVKNQKSSCDQPAESRSEAIPFDRIRTIYNEVCSGKLPEALKVDKKRQSNIRKCWSLEVSGVKPFRSSDFWRQYFTDCLDDSHWTGANDRGWRADLEFLTRESSVLKVLERT